MRFLEIIREWENEGLVRIEGLNVYVLDEYADEVESRLDEIFDYEVYDCDTWSSYYKVDGIVFRVLWFVEE